MSEDQYSHRGLKVWEIDCGERELIAAYSRTDAIEWYRRECGEDSFPPGELEACCDEHPVLLQETHWRDHCQRELGKETLVDSLMDHLESGGKVPFVISSTVY